MLAAALHGQDHGSAVTEAVADDLAAQAERIAVARERIQKLGYDVPAGAPEPVRHRIPVRNA
jgi:hypothetical protein